MSESGAERIQIKLGADGIGRAFIDGKFEVFGGIEDLERWKAMVEEEETSGAERIKVNPEGPPIENGHYLLVNLEGDSVTVERRWVWIDEVGRDRRPHEIVEGSLDMPLEDWKALADWLDL